MVTRIEAEISISNAPFQNMSQEEAFSLAQAELTKFQNFMEEHLSNMNVSQELGLPMTFKSVEFGKIQIRCPVAFSSVPTSLGCGRTIHSYINRIPIV